MAIFGTARFSVKPESLTGAVPRSTSFVTYVRADEPGTRLYISLQGQQDPTGFLHVTIFEDEATEEVHTTSKAVDRFTGILYSETVDRVAFDRLPPVGPA